MKCFIPVGCKILKGYLQMHASPFESINPWINKHFLIPWCVPPTPIKAAVETMKLGEKSLLLPHLHPWRPSFRWEKIMRFRAVSHRCPQNAHSLSSLLSKGSSWIERRSRKCWSWVVYILVTFHYQVIWLSLYPMSCGTLPAQTAGHECGFGHE